MSSYNFNILHEEVSDQDAFEDKMHEKSAENLHRIITTSNAAATIGLEGSWGSGKSTVVNLLKNKLSQDKSSSFIYLFDAWAHDGDPLRRIFLEGLIDNIDPQKENDCLQKIRGEISGRTKTVDIKTRKSTSKLGGILSFSAIFVPLGAALISAIDYKTVYWFSLEKQVHWPLLTGTIFTLMPLWALSVWRWRSKDDPDIHNKGWIKKLFFGRKHWDIFEATSKESFTQDITEDSERTSIEFENFFCQIMKNLIDEEKNHDRIIIVIDNLDRIEPSQTLTIWSILQTFFQYRSHGTNTSRQWKNKLWFLIPYDREGLSKVWDTENNANRDSTADSFLEKCFQLIEEVPEPLFSSWVDFCEGSINKALADWPEEARRKIFDTYKRYESSLTKSPTPRQIQAFVNKVGMLGLRWGGSKSPESLALYALIRRGRSERQLRSELLNPGLPDGYVQENNPNLKSELAGILFGVDKDKGIQLLLEPLIYDAFKSGDHENISGLISEHQQGFWIVWNAICDRLLPSTEHTEEYRTSFTIAFCYGINTHNQNVSRDINRLFETWKSTTQKWELHKDWSYPEALKALRSALKAEAGPFDSWIREQVKGKLRSTINQITDEDIDVDTLYQIRLLMDFLIDLKIPLEPEPFKIMNHQNWKNWLEKLDDSGIEFTEVLPSSTIMNELTAQIDPINAGGEILRLIMRTLDLNDNKSYHSPIVDKLCTWAGTPNHILGYDLPFELLLRLFGASDKQQKEKIKATLIEQNFINRTEKEALNKTPALTALYIAIFENKIFDSTPPIRMPNNVKNIFTSEQAPSFRNEVINNLEKYNALPSIWNQAKSKENLFAIGVIKNGNKNTIYKTSKGAYVFDEYEWASENEIKDIIANLITKNHLSKAKNSYQENPLGYEKCLQHISTYGGDSGISFVNDVLLEISNKSWTESFDSEIELFKLLTGKGNHKFKDGALDFCLDDITKESASKFFWVNFSIIYSKLPDKSETLERVTEKYFENTSDPLDDLSFEVFKKEIPQNTIDAIDSSRITARIENWIKDNRWGRIEWLVSSFKIAKTTGTESLTLRLIEAGNENINEELINKIAKIYSINLPSKTKDDTPTRKQ